MTLWAKPILTWRMLPRALYVRWETTTKKVHCSSPPWVFPRNSLPRHHVAQPTKVIQLRMMTPPIKRSFFSSASCGIKGKRIFKRFAIILPFYWPLLGSKIIQYYYENVINFIVLLLLLVGSRLMFVYWSNTALAYIPELWRRILISQNSCMERVSAAKDSRLCMWVFVSSICFHLNYFFFWRLIQ